MESERPASPTARMGKTTVLLAAALLLLHCAVPPIVYHDGLPAYTPEPGYAYGRCAFNVDAWHVDTSWTPNDYFDLGLRFGQRCRPVRFEEGLTFLATDVFMPTLQLGVGLEKPVITLRGMWTPVVLTSPPQTAWDMWWQLSLLTGSRRPQRGFAWSAGAGASRLGVGPAAAIEYAYDDVAFRLSASGTVRAPWADSTVKGQVLTAGLTLEPRKSLHRSSSR